MSLFEQVVSWLRPKHGRKILRLRRRLRLSFTPLKLRRSLRVLSEVHEERTFPILSASSDLASLLFRLPWLFPCRLPPPPSDIMAYPEEQYMDTHHAWLLLVRLLPLWRWRDTPQRSFFRLYEALCAGDQAYIGYETEYFWKRADPAWTPERLPDPREFGVLAAGEDGERQLAVLASLAESLAESFNWRLMWGLRRNGNHDDTVLDHGPPVYSAIVKAPAWAGPVPPLRQTFALHAASANQAAPDIHAVGFTGDISPFVRRNIMADCGSLRTV